MSQSLIQQDLAHAVETDPIRPMQVGVVLVCALIILVDGFDIMSISFTAASIGAEWQLESQQLGVVFSAALFGMTLGALFLSPFADSIGRRRVILISLTAIGVTMIMTTFVTSVAQLMWLRFATGLSIGAILPGVNSMVAEYAPLRLRNFSLGMMHVAYPAGALVSGIVVKFIMDLYGWRSVFLIGGIASLALIPLAWRWVPESLQFLNERRPPDALGRINAILPKLGHSPIPEMPPPPAQGVSSGVRGLLGTEFRAWTLFYWLASFAVYLGLYFVWSWTPKLVANHGHTGDAGVNVGIIMNIGALFGTLCLGWLSWRLGLRRVLVVYTVAASILILFMAVSLGSLDRLYLVAFPLGFFMIGIPPGIYMIGARMYPTNLRSTGVGIGTGVGRVGAVIGPLIAGVFIAFGWSPLAYLGLLAALPFLIVTVAVTAIGAKELDPYKAPEAPQA